MGLGPWDWRASGAFAISLGLLFFQVQRHQEVAGELHVPAEPLAAQERVSASGRALDLHPVSPLPPGPALCSFHRAPQLLLPALGPITDLLVAPALLQPSGLGADAALPVSAGGLQPLPLLPALVRRPQPGQRGRGGLRGWLCFRPGPPRLSDGHHLSHGRAQLEESR